MIAKIIAIRVGLAAVTVPILLAQAAFSKSDSVFNKLLDITFGEEEQIDYVSTTTSLPDEWRFDQ